MYNLLSNAIKFGRQGAGNSGENVVEFSVSIVDVSESESADNSHITETSPDETEKPKEPELTAESGTKPNSRRTQPYRHILRFVVKDFGTGIEKDNFSKIFQPFLQATVETDRVFGGTGLGLAITSKLVAGLNGTIRVDSELGKWSEFTIDLPFCESLVDANELSKRFQNTRIMLVNRDPNQVPSQGVLDTYKLNVANLRSCEELGALASLNGASNPSISSLPH